MRFIKLTEADSRKTRYINAEFISSLVVVLRVGEETFVQMAGEKDDFFYVVETPEEILAMLDN